MSRLEDGKRWHIRNGHAKFVYSAQTLGWNSVAIDDVCASVLCQTRELYLNLNLAFTFDIEEYICHCGRPVHVYTEPGTNGFTRDICEPCSDIRCDAVTHINVNSDEYRSSCPPINHIPAWYS